MIRRATQTLLLGGGLTGFTYYLHRNDWDVSSIGAVRFGRAAFAAVQVAVDYKWTLHGMADRITQEEYKQLVSQVHLRSALRFREMVCKNGGVFIKVGQHIGALDYLLPREYVSTMQVLHSKAPESRVVDLYRTIEQDLGDKVENLFYTFEERPLGAASLAQVHKATLKDGTQVAVKIQHPRVKANSFVDMATMELLVHGIAWLFPEFKFMWLAEETRKNLPRELDFLNEGQNCERVARMFQHFNFLKVPKVFWKLSSDRVLTMEYCEGGQVNDRDYMKTHNIHVDEVTRKLGDLYSEMIFVQGYVHCDPHPGNVLINKTKKGIEIVLLDHGLYQTLNDDFRLNYCKLWLSLIDANLEGIKHYANVMGCGDLYGLFACILTARSWTAVTKGMDKQAFSDEEENEIRENASNFLIQISDILNRIPREMLLLLKTNDLLRGIEFSLKSHKNASSFINMSRVCVRAVTLYELKTCDNWQCRVIARLSEQYTLFKIFLYELYTWLASTVTNR